MTMDETCSQLSTSFEDHKALVAGTNRHQKKKLRFNHVTIKDMPIELGEHPASEGAPITIGWEAQSTRQVDIDVYELYKEDDPRKREEELRLSATERACILLRAGYEINEIVDACNHAQELLKQRELSSRHQKWEVLHEVGKKACNTIRHKISRSPAA